MDTRVFSSVGLSVQLQDTVNVTFSRSQDEETYTCSINTWWVELIKPMFYLWQLSDKYIKNKRLWLNTDFKQHNAPKYIKVKLKFPMVQPNRVF